MNRSTVQLLQRICGGWFSYSLYSDFLRGQHYWTFTQMELKYRTALSTGQGLGNSFQEICFEIVRQVNEKIKIAFDYHFTLTHLRDLFVTRLVLTVTE